MLIVVVESSLNFNLNVCKKPVGDWNKQGPPEPSHAVDEERGVPIPVVFVEPGVNDVYWYDCYSASNLDNIDGYIINNIADVATKRKDVVVLVYSVRVRVRTLGYCVIIPVKIIGVSAAHAIQPHHERQRKQEEPPVPTCTCFVK